MNARLTFFIGLILCAGIALRAQTKTTTIELPAEILWAGVDRPGDLFLVLKTGEVRKYNKEGVKIGSHLFNAPPRLFDPLDGAQSFYYLAKGNTYGNLSSDVSSTTEHVVDPSFAIHPWLVCPALHELWILDSTDLSIKKTKSHATAISVETSIRTLSAKKTADYVNMREYQNYLFLLDRNAGIHMFNGLGKYVKTILEKDLNYFSFLGEEIYFIRDHQVVLMDLYTDERRKFPIPVPCRFVLLTDDRLYAVDVKKVSIFDFKP